MPSEGSGDSGELFWVVVSHVKEMVFGTFVLDCGSEWLSLLAYVNPVLSLVGGEASKHLPLFVCLGHVFLKEVLPQPTLRRVAGDRHIGGEAINCFIEGDARMGWAV